MTRLALLALIGFFLLLAPGCSRDKDPLVVTVGEDEVRLSEFQWEFDQALKNGDEYAPDTASVRRFLDRCVEDRLLAQIAADSVSWTPLLEHRARSYLEMRMIREMREGSYRHVMDIPEEDLRAVYEKARTRYRYRAMHFPHPSEALPVRETLRQGAIFKAVASHYGFENGGDTGWHTALDAPEALIDLLEGLKPDEVGGPLRVGSTTYLVQFLEKEPNPDPLPSFEQIKETIKIRLMQQRAGNLIFDFEEGLLTKYNYEVHPLEITWMTQFLHQKTKDIPRQPPAHGGPTQDPVPWTSCPLEKQDWDRMLVTSTADTVTAILLLDHLMTKLLMEWPLFEKEQDVIRLCREILLDRVQRAESWASGMDKRPDLAAEDRQERRRMLIRNLRQTFGWNRVLPTFEEAQAWYATHAADFGEPEKRRFFLLHVRDWDTALQARQIFANAGSPAQAMGDIRRLDQTAAWVESGQGEISAGSSTAPLDRQLMRIEPGMVTEPIPFEDRFAIARLEEIVPPRIPPFETIAEQVINAFTRARSDSLVQQWMEARRATVPVVVHEEVLSRVRLEGAKEEA